MITAVKERPILFSAPMVRAILEERKTQTRRVVKPQPGEYAFLDEAEPGLTRFGYDYFVGAPTDNNVEQVWQLIKCPYGKPGQRLWVRESWRYAGVRKNGEYWDKVFTYKAGGERIIEACSEDIPDKKGWVPSIHMPRWASRITLEITNIRVERKDDITLEDAIAEGFGDVREFNELFLALNPHLKDQNPWVWVVEFKPVGERE
jgi:hypothetical protein